jgi:hypothetical protein
VQGIFLFFFFFFFLLSWDLASLIYSSITNKIQRYTTVFIIINAVRVSGGSSAHHQELKTIYTASSIYEAFSASYRYRGKKQKKLDKETKQKC